MTAPPLTTSYSSLFILCLDCFYFNLVYDTLLLPRKILSTGHRCRPEGLLFQNPRTKTTSAAVGMTTPTSAKDIAETTATRLARDTEASTAATATAHSHDNGHHKGQGHGYDNGHDKDQKHGHGHGHSHDSAQPRTNGLQVQLLRRWCGLGWARTVCKEGRIEEQNNQK